MIEMKIDSNTHIGECNVQGNRIEILAELSTGVEEILRMITKDKPILFNLMKDLLFKQINPSDESL